MSLQPHLKVAKGDVADVVLLPGDPGRIEKIIRDWEDTQLVASNREFLIYTGVYKGTPISVCSTGIGCPSAAIAVEELANVGARVFIRVGTCGSLKSEIKVGDIVIPQAAIRAEGTTAEYLPKEFPAIADIEVVGALSKTAERLGVNFFSGINRTHDAFYERTGNLQQWSTILRDERMSSWAYPLVSSEMECSAIFLIALLRGLKAGAILTVNTVEPLDNHARASMYDLVEDERQQEGMSDAIRVALEASKSLYADGILLQGSNAV